MLSICPSSETLIRVGGPKTAKSVLRLKTAVLFYLDVMRETVSTFLSLITSLWCGKARLVSDVAVP